MSGDKTEKPTAQKKKQGRKEGQVARSPDIGAWAGMLAASMLVPLTITIASDRTQALLRRFSDNLPRIARVPLPSTSRPVAAASAPTTTSATGLRSDRKRYSTRIVHVGGPNAGIKLTPRTIPNTARYATTTHHYPLRASRMRRSV